MDGKIVKSFALGALSAYGLAAFVLLSSAKLGVLPVQADVTPSRVEAALLGAALRASVARHVSSDPNRRLSPSGEDVSAGTNIYHQMCSRCHGGSRESANLLGRSFDPPAPNLLQARSAYSRNELFWIVKHGIRNTAMPAWGNLLSDGDIEKVVAFLQKADSTTDLITQ